MPLTRAARCLVGAAPAALKVAGFNPPPHSCLTPLPAAAKLSISDCARARGCGVLDGGGIAGSCTDGSIIAARWSFCRKKKGVDSSFATCCGKRSCLRALSRRECAHAYDTESHVLQSSPGQCVPTTLCPHH